MPDNITQIPSMRVPVIDAQTGLISREWFRFFFNLYNLTGGGSSALTINDLLVGPADSQISTFQDAFEDQIQALDISSSSNSLLSAQNQTNANVHGLNLLPTEAIFEASQSVINESIKGLEEVPFDAYWTASERSINDQLQALALSPSYTPQKSDSRYGVFYDTTTQSAAAINTEYAITFNSTSLSNGVYVGSPTSRVYVDRPGVYDFQFSAQLDQSSSAAHDVYIWADINGTAVADSATKITLVGNNAAAVAAWNFVLKLNAGDYFRLMWSVSDTSCQIISLAASAPVPAIPSVILTVTNNIGE